MRCLLVLFLFSSWTTLVSAQACDLDCYGDSFCVEEDAADDFDDDEHFIDLTKSLNGQYCECPPNYTGVLCDVQVESCEGSNHKCYFGGTCFYPSGVEDFSLLFCDCSTAIDADGHKYSGKYCEHKADGETYCNGNEEDFCLNGAMCNPDYPDFGPLCLCKDGFEGSNCQYATGTVPDCDLDCQAGGTCHLGTRNDDDQTDFWTDHDHMYCDCPPDRTGKYCELEQDVCGCVNGGTCVQRDVNGETVHHCDCTTTYTEATSYAGRYCQYPAESYCAKNEGLNGHLFCTNGGTCKPDATEGCNCQPGFSGFSCEFTDDEFDDDELDVETGTIYEGTNGLMDPDDLEDDLEDGLEDDQFFIYEPGPDDATCSLDCKMGTCRYGKKDIGYFQDVTEDIDYLNDSFSDDFEHCVCPDGYVGLMCEHKVEVCGDNEHLCLHGGECVSNNGNHACDCSTATDSDMASAFAGDYCEHPANDICTIGTPGPGKPLSFCVNNGRCAKQVTPDEPHPGCICNGGWEGPHCELRYNKNNKSSSSSDGRSAVDVFFATGFFLAMIVLVVLGVTYCIRRRNKRRNAALTSSLKWGSHYTDRPPPVNIAPRRQSSISNIYPTTTPATTETTTTDTTDDEPPTPVTPPPQSPPSSSTDPFSTNLAPSQPEVYIGPPRDEDGHELHSVEIL